MAEIIFCEAVMSVIGASPPVPGVPECRDIFRSVVSNNLLWFWTLDSNAAEAIVSRRARSHPVVRPRGSAVSGSPMSFSRPGDSISAGYAQDARFDGTFAGRAV